jgi:hypothetical protein
MAARDDAAKMRLRGFWNEVHGERERECEYRIGRSSSVRASKGSGSVSGQ